MARQVENYIELKNPVDVKITDGQTIKVVHVNRLQHHKQPQHDNAYHNTFSVDEHYL